jgi:L-ribulose-5-phosphate 4-epimerase
VLVPQHGPFVWGKTPAAALDNAVALEEIARMAMYAVLLNPQAQELGQTLLDKHFTRKHGSKAYYGQKD